MPLDASSCGRNASARRLGGRRPGLCWVAAGLLLWLAGSSVGAATLTATLDRNMVPLGESVTLSLIFEGGAPAGSPRLPDFPGVRVQPGVSQRREFSFVNGKQSARQIFDYVLVPAQLGDVVVPSLQIQVVNEVLTSQALLLKVVEGSAQNAVTNLAFLRLIVPQKQVYVGEPFRVEMQLYVRSATDVNHPQLAAEGFSFSQPKQGQQTRTQVAGNVFDVVTFQLAATPVKAGSLKMGPATCDLTLLIPLSTPSGGWIRLAIRLVCLGGATSSASPPRSPVKPFPSRCCRCRPPMCRPRSTARWAASS